MHHACPAMRFEGMVRQVQQQVRLVEVVEEVAAQGKGICEFLFELCVHRDLPCCGDDKGS
jgi:hypothetical protein